MIKYGNSGNRFIITKTELEKTIINCYNEAIEAAALIVQPNPHVDEERKCEDIAEKIRNLKKIEIPYKNKGLSGF